MNLNIVNVCDSSQNHSEDMCRVECSLNYFTMKESQIESPHRDAEGRDLSLRCDIILILCPHVCP